MPGTAVGLFVIDFLVRPFAKIGEKMPIVMIGFILVLYALVAYAVVKSVYFADQTN